MGRRLACALAQFVALLAAMVLNHGTMAQTPEQKLWTLLGDSEATYVSLGEADFRALGAGFDLPDGGKAITRLAAPSIRATSQSFLRSSSATRRTGSSSASVATISTGTSARYVSRAWIPRRRAIRGSSS
jgi:hypothetical protein